MQDISSLFWAHSSFVCSTIASMLVPFQNSFLAGWPIAIATTTPNTTILAKPIILYTVSSSLSVSLFLLQQQLPRVWLWLDDCAALTDADRPG